MPRCHQCSSSPRLPSTLPSISFLIQIFLFSSYFCIAFMQKNWLSNMYTFILSYSVKLSALKNRRNALGLVCVVELICTIETGRELLHLADSPTRLLENSLECSIYYNEKFEWLQDFQCGFDFFICTIYFSSFYFRANESLGKKISNQSSLIKGYRSLWWICGEQEQNKFLFISSLGILNAMQLICLWIKFPAFFSSSVLLLSFTLR